MEDRRDSSPALFNKMSFKQSAQTKERDRNKLHSKSQSQKSGVESQKAWEPLLTENKIRVSTRITDLSADYCFLIQFEHLNC